MSSLKRTSLAHDLKTIAETVLGYEMIGRCELEAPLKTFPAIIARLNAEINKALSSPELRENCAGKAQTRRVHATGVCYIPVGCEWGNA